MSAESQPILKHPRLAALHALWRQRRAGAQVPAAEALNPAELRLWLGNLLLIDVVKGADFVYRYYGQVLADAFGTDMVGQSIGQLPAEQRDILFAEYDQVRGGRRPSARIYTADFEGRLETWERLVLPLSDDGASVSKLLVAAYRLEPAAQVTALPPRG
jgi:hypothetical protein